MQVLNPSMRPLAQVPQSSVRFKPDESNIRCSDALNKFTKFSQHGPGYVSLFAAVEDYHRKNGSYPTQFPIERNDNEVEIKSDDGKSFKIDKNIIPDSCILGVPSEQFINLSVQIGYVDSLAVSLMNSGTNSPPHFTLICERNLDFSGYTIDLHQITLKPFSYKINGNEADLKHENIKLANLRGVALTRYQVIDICNTARTKGYPAPLAGVDLSEADLSGVDFREVYLAGANLSRAVLTRQQVIDICYTGLTEGYPAPLARVNLSGVDLSGVYLSKANLIEANLSAANFSGANLRDADLRYANFRGADLRGADFTGADLSRADLSGADFTGADFTGADLSRADLSRANFRGADLSRVALTRQQVIDICNTARAATPPYSAPLAGVNLLGVDLSGVGFNGVDLNGADLRGVALTRQQVIDICNTARAATPPYSAPLAGTNLSNANLEDVDLSWANFSGANFSGANLINANLEWTNFSGANFSGAKLINVNLYWTNFSGVNFSGAKLSWVRRSEDAGFNYHTNLKDANLNGVALTRQQVINICNTARAATPPYSAPLAGTDLGGVFFLEVDVSGANLSGVALTRYQVIDICDTARAAIPPYSAPLAGTNLRGVNLGGVNFRGVDFRGADLREATLMGASYDEHTIVDETTIVTNAKIEGINLALRQFYERNSAVEMKMNMNLLEGVEIRMFGENPFKKASLADRRLFPTQTNMKTGLLITDPRLYISCT